MVVIANSAAPMKDWVIITQISGGEGSMPCPVRLLLIMLSHPQET